MSRTHHPMNAPASQRGFTLVELMISLLLGLLVISAAGSIFFSSRNVYGNTEALNRIQENQRSAYEMMARDIREAGGNPCTKNIVNMLDPSKSGGDFSGWLNGVSGANNTGPNGSDEITLSSAFGSSIVVTGNAEPSANIDVNSTAGLNDGDILMVCNGEVASIFQATALPSGISIQHNSGTGTPGNLAKPFQIDQEAFDNAVGGTNAPGYCFMPDPVNPNPNCLNKPSNSPAQVVKPISIRWRLKDNTRGGTSLYRQELSNGGTTLGPEEEIAEGVTDLQLTYKLNGVSSYVDASSALAWGNVTAVRMQMTFVAAQGAMAKGDVKGTTGAALTRTLDDYILIRNHQALQ